MSEVLSELVKRLYAESLYPFLSRMKHTNIINASRVIMKTPHLIMNLRISELLIYESAIRFEEPPAQDSNQYVYSKSQILVFGKMGKSVLIIS